MDCTVFDWETTAPMPPGIIAVGAAEARALLRQTLRVVYPVAEGHPFDDLVSALDRSANDD